MVLAASRIRIVHRTQRSIDCLKAFPWGTAHLSLPFEPQKRAVGASDSPFLLSISPLPDISQIAWWPTDMPTRTQQPQSTSLATSGTVFTAEERHHQRVLRCCGASVSPDLQLAPYLLGFQPPGIRPPHAFFCRFPGLLPVLQVVEDRGRRGILLSAPRASLVPPPASVTSAIPRTTLVLRAGTMGIFFSRCTAPLFDQTVFLSDALGAEGHRWEQRLAATAVNETAERALLLNLLQERMHRPAVLRFESMRALLMQLEHLPSGSSLAALCARNGIGDRRLHRLFNELVGTSPVRVRRILRCGRIFLSMLKEGQQAIGAQASRWGYESHGYLCDDLRELTGCSPKALHAAIAATPKPICWSLLDPGRRYQDAGKETFSASW